MKQINNSSERLFADICSQRYLKGFVFHSPKYADNFSNEVGDVVVWIRNQIIVFEIVWRNELESKSTNTKCFLKRIGEKRRQLEKDYEIFSSMTEKIHLRSENGEVITFAKDNFHPDNFSGIIVIDSEVPLGEINFKTYEKTLQAAFPIMIITKKTFLEIISEVDTLPDLLYYCRDRNEFVKQIFPSDYKFFLNVDRMIDKDLMAFYKVNEYQFPLDSWKGSEKKIFWEEYQKTHAQKIRIRDKENEHSFVIDQLIDALLTIPGALLHASELAIFTRRARAGSLSQNMISAFERLPYLEKLRYYAVYNETTECWLLFYFQLGGDLVTFQKQVEHFSKLKLFYEMHKNKFNYSIFGYGFRKSIEETSDTVDDLFLCIEDAVNYTKINREDLLEAYNLFGNYSTHEIKEFPS